MYVLTCQKITTSHDVTFSRIQSRNFEILKRCYIKFGTICKYDLCCIWKLFGNKKESLPILATFVWTRYLVQTPGRLGSAHPMPQLTTPTRVSWLVLLSSTTRGPPLSPWHPSLSDQRIRTAIRQWAHHLSPLRHTASEQWRGSHNPWLGKCSLFHPSHHRQYKFNG